MRSDRQLLKDALNKFEKDGYKLNFKYNRLGKQNVSSKGFALWKAAF